MSPTQRRRQCGTMQSFEELAEENPSVRAKQTEINDLTARSIATGEAQRLARRRITIRWSSRRLQGQTGEHLQEPDHVSDHRAQERLRSQNPDIANVSPVWQGLAANPKIEFKLATRNPDGKATDGITRAQTDRDSFPAYKNPVKKRSEGGAPAWATDRCLNLWVSGLAGKLLGYAQFPGGPARTDGVLILRSAFGTTGTVQAPFDKGRTATHEIGHWLELATSGQTRSIARFRSRQRRQTRRVPTTGAQRFPHLSCANGPNGDMFMNYMDYTNDAAMFMFMPGQVIRMNAALAGPRSPSPRRAWIDGSVDPERLIGSWVHSHEEDTATEQVFRRADYAFPPSRGRKIWSYGATGRSGSAGPGQPTPPKRSRDWALEGSNLMICEDNEGAANVRCVAGC